MGIEGLEPRRQAQIAFKRDFAYDAGAFLYREPPLCWLPFNFLCLLVSGLFFTAAPASFPVAAIYYLLTARDCLLPPFGQVF